MRVVREHDVKWFLDLVGPHLRERPAENNLVLGLLGDFVRAGGIPGRETPPQDVRPVLLAVEGAQGIEGMDHLAFVRGKRAARQLFLWENDTPLSLAAWQGRTEQGVRVSYVYTLPAERKKGYASAVVAALSQRLLDEGNARCFLFTNADNATSNKIYRSLGYDPVSDFRLFDFPCA